jgi:apolipoprotein N-acyltransferase
LLATIAFEFGFGHFVAGHSWSKLLADYNVFNGRLWLLVLVWITIMPYGFYQYG